VRLQLLCNLGKEMRPKCLLKDAFYCHSERSEDRFLSARFLRGESWLSSNPAESDENIQNASHVSSPPAPRNDRRHYKTLILSMKIQTQITK